MCLGPKGHFAHETENMWPFHFKHSHWWKTQSRSKFASHYAWGTNGVSECKMYVKAYMYSHMASNGSCFTITWIIFKNHLLEVGLTKPRDHGTLKAYNGRFTLSYHTWDIHWNLIRLRARSHMTSQYTQGSVTTLHDFGGVFWRPLDTFFGLSQFHGHGSWLVCEVALSYDSRRRRRRRSCWEATTRSSSTIAVVVCRDRPAL